MPWYIMIPTWVLAIAAIAAVGVTIYLNHIDKKAAMKHELIQNRKKALFDALTAIDHVLANTSFDGLLEGKPPDPHSWDKQLARDAMNQMIIYCKEPNAVVNSFMKAIRLHNPKLGKPPPSKPLKDLEEFRVHVCRELEMPKLEFKDKYLTWIAVLPGTSVKK